MQSVKACAGRICLGTKGSVCLIAAACVIAAFVPGAAASLLPPGMAALAVAEPDPIGGIVIAGGVPVPFVSPTFNGTLTSSVLVGDASNPFGGLTFTYLLQNNPASPGEIDRLTVNGFAGFLTDVSFQVPTAGLAPTINDHSPAAGDVIGFSFIGVPLGPGALLPGQLSALLVVQTNASQFATTFASVIDGGVTSVPSFAPIPEPASLSLLAMGGLALIRRHK